jgi:hypothetical protein
MKLTDEQIAAIRDGTEGVTPYVVFTDGDIHLRERDMNGIMPKIGHVKASKLVSHIARCDPDTIRALATESLESRAAEERWRSNSRETFDAMVAMRNDINEHIPLPSIESDLARGPGNDVFCAEVAQGVVTALVAKNARVAELEGALRQAEEWFRAYAQGHYAKGDCDKAKRNHDRADYCNRAALGRDET